MTLDPFVWIELRGVSVITATWLMFMAVGSGAFIYWTLREFGSIWKRLDKHGESILETRQDVSTVRENVAVTRSIVERIDKKFDKES